MSNEFNKKEIAKILNTEGKEFSEKLAMASAWILANYKGLNIKVIDMKDTSSLCDYNIIASAENTIQARAMVDEFSKSVQSEDINIVSLEGLQDGEWILVDFGDVIIHIFQETSRDIFDLDQLWGELPRLEIPQEYYFGNAAQAKTQKEEIESYF